MYLRIQFMETVTLGEWTHGTNIGGWLDHRAAMDAVENWRNSDRQDRSQVTILTELSKLCVIRELK
jgi:hypothetical protein